MNTFLALLRIELLLHRRSLRSRIVLVIYPLLTLATALLVPNLTQLVSGPATVLARVALIQPICALVLAFGLAGRGADRASREEILPLLAGSGLRNSTLVFGRAAIQCLLLLGITGLTHAALLLSFLVQGWPIDVAAHVDIWLFWSWPMATILSFTVLALTLIGGSDLAAILLLLVGALLQSQLSGFLKGLETTFSWPFVASSTQQLGFLFSLNERALAEVPFIASEAPIDLWVSLERRAADLLPAAGLAVLLLSIAFLNLGRHRPDLPARSFAFAPSLGRLRQSLAADAGLGREKAWLLIGLAAAAAGIFYSEHRARVFLRWGEERLRAEITSTEALTAGTNPSLELLGLRVHADLGNNTALAFGNLETEFEAHFRQQGEPLTQSLVFRLNPFVEVESLEALVGPENLELTQERLYDRLFVRLGRQLRQGESLTLRSRLKGRPASPLLKLKPRHTVETFGESWSQLIHDPRERPRIRLAAGDRHPAISRNQIRLDAESLFPLPRYSSFQVTTLSTNTPPIHNWRAESDPTPPENHPGTVPIELEISGPAGIALFSSCGQKASVASGRSRLRGTCITRPSELAIRGGPWEVIEQGPLTVATLPIHSAAVQPLLESLEQIHAQSAKAWPGAPALGDVILIERSPQHEALSPMLRFSYHSVAGVDAFARPLLTFGQILEIDERRLLAPQHLDPLELMEPLLVGRFLKNRRLEGEEAWGIKTFLREVVGLRLGLRTQGALVHGPEMDHVDYSLPINVYQNFHYASGQIRVAALVVDLEGRVGSSAVQRGIETFFADEAAEPGKLSELIAAIGAHSGKDLGSFYSDFFEKGALPRLALTGVTRRALGSNFEISGELQNKGRGEVLCPVIVHTDQGEILIEVRVTAESSTPFRVETPQKPVAVELDPRRTCFRFATLSDLVLERVDL